jgi:hypothetical protein
MGQTWDAIQEMIPVITTAPNITPQMPAACTPVLLRDERGGGVLGDLATRGDLATL